MESSSEFLKKFRIIQALMQDIELTADNMNQLENKILILKVFDFLKNTKVKNELEVEFDVETLKQISTLTKDAENGVSMHITLAIGQVLQLLNDAIKVFVKNHNFAYGSKKVHMSRLQKMLDEDSYEENFDKILHTDFVARGENLMAIMGIMILSENILQHVADNTHPAKGCKK